MIGKFKHVPDCIHQFQVVSAEAIIVRYGIGTDIFLVKFFLEDTVAIAGRLTASIRFLLNTKRRDAGRSIIGLLQVGRGRFSCATCGAVVEKPLLFSEFARLADPLWCDPIAEDFVPGYSLKLVFYKHSANQLLKLRSHPGNFRTKAKLLLIKQVDKPGY